MTRDPAAELTREPYAYAGDDPMDLADPGGLLSFGDVTGAIEGVAGVVDGGCAVTWEIPVVDVGTCGGAAVTTTVAAGAVAGAAVAEAVAGESDNELEEGSPSAQEVPCGEQTRNEIPPREPTDREDRQFSEKLGHSSNSNSGIRCPRRKGSRACP